MKTRDMKNKIKRMLYKPKGSRVLTSGAASMMAELEEALGGKKKDAAKED